jgi:hypothetical protein
MAIVPLDVKMALVERARVEKTTLDGEPAIVSGYGLPFASVRRKDGRGGDVQFAWATVEFILDNRSGAFRS